MFISKSDLPSFSLKKILKKKATIALAVSSGSFLFIFLLLLALPSSALEQSPWKYRVIQNNFDDKMFTFAWSSKAKYQYDNDFSIGFKCKDGRLSFEVDVGTFITGKGEVFKVHYRVDTRDSKIIQMKTHLNSNNGGNTSSYIPKIAEEIIKGEKIYMRVIGWNNDFFETQISLSGAKKMIQKVFSDCLIAISNNSLQHQINNYSLDNFLDDYKKLTPNLQKVVLEKIKTFLTLLKLDKIQKNN